MHTDERTGSGGAATVGDRYLTDEFAPVPDEIEAFDLDVTGSLPPELDGVVARIGPNPFGADPASRPMFHWFLGDGMLHGVDLQGGRARWYRNRWVRTPALAAVGGPSACARADDAHPFNPANTAVLRHSGRILALCEAGLPYEVDDELATIGAVDFGGLRRPMFAHPKIDPRTGDLWACGVELAQSVCTVEHVDAAGQLVATLDVPLRAPVMVHDMALTDSAVVLFELPIAFDAQLGAAGTFPYRWQPELGARVGVLPRDAVDAGDVAALRWFDVAPGYWFHTVNAWDETADGAAPGDATRVVVDCVRYDTAFADMDGATRTGPLWGAEPTVHRVTLDPRRGTASETTLSDAAFEFPQIDHRRDQQPYRWAYGVGLRHVDGSPASSEADLDFVGLVRLDAATGDVEVHDTTGAASEPLLATGPSDAEGDGWVLSFVHDPARGAADLVVVDASDFTSPPVARVHLPRRVPNGFHGTWMPRTTHMH